MQGQSVQLRCEAVEVHGGPRMAGVIGPKRRAGVIKGNAAEMHVVYCPRCGQGMGESRLLPGILNRYRCRRCGDWTTLLGAAVRAEAEGSGSDGMAADHSVMQVVLCTSCGRAVGETRLVPGAVNRYRCDRCGEWTWLVGVGDYRADP